MSRKAVRSPEEARKHASQLITFFNPDVVVTEEFGQQSRKGNHARKITAAIRRVAENAGLKSVTAPRLQAYQNKYEEAHALAERFPDMTSSIPQKPPAWESEPLTTIYFEALALALKFIENRKR